MKRFAYAFLAGAFALTLPLQFHSKSAEAVSKEDHKKIQKKIIESAGKTRPGESKPSGGGSGDSSTSGGSDNGDATSGGGSSDESEPESPESPTPK